MKKIKDTFRWRPVYLGLVVAVLFLCMSFLPSLLPRPWWLQGVVSGLSLAVGYGLGLGLSALVRYLVDFELSKHFKEVVWRVSLVVLLLLGFSFFVLGFNWQNQIHQLLGTAKLSPFDMVLVGVVALAVFFICLFISRLIGKMGRAIISLIRKVLPPRLGLALGLIISVFVVYYIVSGLFVTNFYRLADKSFSTRNDTTPSGVVQPSSELRSGSPESLVAWDKIGYQGRAFVGSGPTLTQIADFNGAPASEPIRIYAGMEAGNSPEELAQLAVEELKRTKAFERDVLVIATATGTGWLDPKVIDSLEFIHSGNTAVVSQQYSYLPSWISFLVDQGRAKAAGRALYDAVYDEWAKLPVAERPKLLVYGLSLGSFGAQEAFSGVNDIRRSVDGALFVGSPNESSVWRKVTDNRDQGSPEWQPIYRQGQTVRFASTKEDILKNRQQWSSPSRILFLQHANDPVVWFSFDLIFNQPDWLREPRGPGVSPSTRWFPIVTFLQVGLDQAVAGSAPKGQGHYYTDTPVYAWSSLYAPPNWNQLSADRLQAYIDDGFRSGRLVGE